MTDLETKLRELFQKKVDESSSAPPQELPQAARKTVRQRQWIFASTAVVLLAGLTVATAIGAGLLRRSGPEPAVGPTPRPTGSLVTAKVELDTGTMPGGSWSLSVNRLPDSLCVELHVQAPRLLVDVGACDGPEEHGLSPEEDDGLTVSAWAFRSLDGDSTFVLGGAGRELERVVVRSSGLEDVPARLFAPPEFLQVPFDLYLAIVPGIVSGEAVGLDSAGRETVAVPFEPRPANRLEGDLIPCGDSFGNVVGYLPAGDGGALTGTWSAPGQPVGASKLRRIAASPLQDVWNRVGEWWDGRPPSGANNEDFLAWWDAYPVSEDLTP